MSPARRPGLAEVVLCVEQLRRRVPGGIGTYAEGLLLGLATFAPSERPPLALYASRSPVVPDPLVRFGVPLRTSVLPGPLLVRAWAAGIARVSSAGLVHAVSLAAPRSSAPVVVTVHDLAFRDVPEAFPSRGRRWHEAALRRVAEQAACVVVPSELVASGLAGAGIGLSRERIEVIEEGADHLPEPDVAATGVLLSRLGVVPPYLLTVGTLEPRKNLGRLFQAYGRARAGLPRAWPLVVVGPTGWGSSIGPPPAGVVFAGEVSPAVLSGLYAGARVAIYVPLVEGFGLPVVEAMRAGAPVVSSPVPSAKGASLAVEPTDVEAIAEAIVRAGLDDATREALVAAGTARVSSCTWRRAAEAHVELWRRVAERR